MNRRFLGAATIASVIAATLIGLQPASAHADTPPASPPVATDATIAPDESTASTIAAEYNHAVAVDDETTPTSQVSAEPDGTMTLQSNAEPVRVQQNGTWIPVDTTLQTDASWIAPTASAANVRFSPGGSDVMAQVQTDGGAWISETWPDGSLPAPQLSGSTATYADVLHDVDLQLTATATGMAEVFVVKNAAAAADPALSNLELQMPNASLSVNSQQSTVAKAADDSTVTSAPPTWWDSSQSGANAKGPGGAGEPQPLPHTTDGDSVNLEVAAVTDQETKYPLYVDPDWTPVQQAYWFTDRAYPNQSYLNGNASAGYQSVGWANQNGITYLSRAFWQFDTAPVAGKLIGNVSLDIPLSYSCAATPIQLWTYGFVTKSGFTWNTDPQEWNSLVQTLTPVSASGCQVSDRLQFDAKSGIVANAAANQTHIQFGIRASDESGAVTSRKHLGQNATLTISYDSTPRVPTNMKFSGPPRACGANVANSAWMNNAAQAIVVQASQSDPDAGTLKTLFQVSKTTSLGTNAVGVRETDGEAQGAISVNYPKNTFANNTNYAIRAETYDGLAFSDWSAWCYFTISDTPPPLPAVTQPPVVTIGQTVSVTATAPVASVRGFVGWITPGAFESHAAIAPVQVVSPLADYHNCAPAAINAIYVCNTTGTATLTFPVTDENSAIHVASIDRAGNISLGTDADGVATVARGVNVTGNRDPAVSLANGGHSWLGDGSTSTTISDTDTSTGTSFSAPKSLTVGTAAVPDPLNSSGNSTPGVRPVLVGGGPASATDLFFSGAAPQGTPATTTGPVIDQTKNFSVSAWLAPANITAVGQTMTAVAETGASGPAFALQQSGGSWQFCLKTQNTGAQQCVATPIVAAPGNAWTFVTGIWNASNGQISIVVNGSIGDSASVEQARAAVSGDTAATGPLLVGAATSASGTGSNPWVGDITDVAVVPGLPSSTQLRAMMRFADPNAT